MDGTRLGSGFHHMIALQILLNEKLTSFEVGFHACNITHTEKGAKSEAQHLQP
jgi:hypothetical protein